MIVPRKLHLEAELGTIADISDVCDFSPATDRPAGSRRRIFYKLERGRQLPYLTERRRKPGELHRWMRRRAVRNAD
jgi:hypothetical protein